MTEIEIVGWHHRLDGHKFEHVLEASDAQGSLVCCSLWGHKELDMTQQLNWTKIMSSSLRPHGLQHTRLPCASPSPRAYLYSCLSSRWCHPTISSSVVPFSSRLQSFPVSGSFPMSRFFASVAKVLEFQLQHQSFRIDWLDLLAVQRTLKSLLQHHSSKASVLQSSAFFIVQLTFHTWPLEKP